jgi:hypothetical protein
MFMAGMVSMPLSTRLTCAAQPRQATSYEADGPTLGARKLSVTLRRGAYL